MPIPAKYKKVLKSMNKTYCTSKYGKDGIKDKKTDGISTCKKSRQVFFAWANKKGISLSLILSELLDLTVEVIMDEQENTYS